jgi:hypothetical protein
LANEFHSIIGYLKQQRVLTQNQLETAMALRASYVELIEKQTALS